MKSSSDERTTPVPGVEPAPLKRRGMLFGTGAAVAAGVAAAVVSRGLQAPAAEPAAPAAKDDGVDGYRLSQHVLRYYETIRI